ncbi:hypothetical protein BGZ65_010531 [Modicella reniformis]|uniref:C2H2-type domain-containing protein n=1 Tax=Modicella reniformis TaxID=1440133 RepID=A0A9P6M7Y8_9FUNG|nr:hypothetical protein BGZ65_010531 [Modicella reniformis]
MPTSPPLSSTDPSTPTTPKSRSRAGSKSRSRPTSTSSSVSVRNASAPYSPSIPSNTTQSGVGNSRSPSLVPLSPVPPINHGSAADPEMVGPPTPAYETGLIIVPGTLGGSTAAITGTGAGGAATTVVQGGTGGKARRISRTKVPAKSRSRSSTITSTSSALGTPSEATASLMNSPFSLMLSEQDEKTLQGLAEQAAADGRNTATTTPGEEIDTFHLDPAAQLQQQQQHQQQQQLDSSMFDLSLIPDEGDESLEAEGYDAEDGDMGEESLMAIGAGATSGISTASTSSSSTSTASSSPAPGKPIPCPIPSCSKSFTRPFNLNAHVKSHDTLKPYGCHVCSRVFSRKHDLQRHIRVHTGSKPYVCVNCQKAFARTDALCRHYKVEEPCRLFMQQDEVRKQAQQQVQQQLHQEQIELQQAQEAHAKAKAEAEAQVQAQAGSMMGSELMETKLAAMSIPLSMEQAVHQQQQQQLHQQHGQQFQQHHQLGPSAMELAAVTPSVAANRREQDQAQP